MLFCSVVSGVLVKLRLVEVQHMEWKTYLRCASMPAVHMLGLCSRHVEALAEMDTVCSVDEALHMRFAVARKLGNLAVVAYNHSAAHAVGCGVCCCRCVVPIGMLFAVTLWMGNAAYMFLSVSFIQMLKVSSA